MPSAIESSQIEYVSSQFVTTNATPSTAPGANKVAQLRRNWNLIPKGSQPVARGKLAQRAPPQESQSHSGKQSQRILPTPRPPEASARHPARRDHPRSSRCQAPCKPTKRDCPIGARRTRQRSGGEGSSRSLTPPRRPAFPPIKHTHPHLTRSSISSVSFVIFTDASRSTRFVPSHVS